MSQHHRASAPGVVGTTVPSVELLHWPADADRREELRREGRPRLLLLGPAVLPPGLADHEDWIRLPADERDVSARLQRLASRGPSAKGLQPGEVTVDHDGLVRWRDHWVTTAPMEAVIIERLAATPGRLVSRDELITLVWGDRLRRPHSLDSRICKVRLRLQAIGLAIHTQRGRGFVLTTTSEAMA